MGLWGSIKSAASKVWNGAKKIAKKAVQATVDVVKATIEAVKHPVKTASKVWNSITGKDTFDEAKELLRQITLRYDKAKAKYEDEVSVLSSSLEEKIKTINYHKKDIFNNHFHRFTNLANRLYNLEIEGKSFLEYFDSSITQVKNQKGVRKKAELYQIDFDNLKFSEITFGILTLGFSTRKKAKQTLIKVKEEEQRIEEEIVKMKSQVRKLKVVAKSIDNVVEYFEVLILNYAKLLDRFEFGISTQMQKQLFMGKLLNGKLDFKLMPIVHIEEFQVLFNLSIVLKQMATMGYLSDTLEVNKEDIKMMNTLQYKTKQLVA